MYTDRHTLDTDIYTDREAVHTTHTHTQKDTNHTNRYTLTLSQINKNTNTINVQQ